MKSSIYTIEEFRENYDWQNAFQNYSWNDRENNSLTFVKRVVCADEGCNDGPSWICVAELDDGRYVIVDAGCDYTGWDCQSWGGIVDYFDSEAEALSNLTPEQAERLEVTNVGHN